MNNTKHQLWDQRMSCFREYYMKYRGLPLNRSRCFLIVDLIREVVESCLSVTIKPWRKIQGWGLVCKSQEAK